MSVFQSIRPHKFCQWAAVVVQDVLWGRVAPSGKLPLTFPNDEDETWLESSMQYPGDRPTSSYESMTLASSSHPKKSVLIFGIGPYSFGSCRWLRCGL